jgi:hypothetical protein
MSQLGADLCSHSMYRCFLVLWEGKQVLVICKSQHDSLALHQQTFLDLLEVSWNFWQTLSCYSFFGQTLRVLHSYTFWWPVFLQESMGLHTITSSLFMYIFTYSGKHLLSISFVSNIVLVPIIQLWIRLFQF